MAMQDGPLGWGIIGTGSISETVASQIAQTSAAKVVAVSSRSAEKAASFAAKHAIPASYSSVDALLATPAVEADYVAVPHSLHLETGLAALDAGKHVLCEKPMGLDAREVAKIAAHPRARDLTIGEGFMLRHQPQWLWLDETIRGGGLGTVRAVHIHNGLTVPRGAPDPTRGKLAGDGSLLLDIGCYSVHQARTIFGGDPLAASAHIEFDDEGRDVLVDATLRFPTGAAHITLGTTLRRGRRIHILGSAGSVEMLTPVFAPGGAARLLVALAGNDGEPEERSFPIGNQYGAEIEEFSAAARAGRQPLVDLANALGNAKTLDAIRASGAVDGVWVSV